MIKSLKNLIVFITIIFLVSCNKNNLTVRGIKGKVKCIDEIFYETEQKFGEWKHTKKLNTERTVFDEDGFISEISKLNAKNKLEYRVIYQNITPLEDSKYKEQITKVNNDYRDYYLSKNIIKTREVNRLGIIYDSLGEYNGIQIVDNNYEAEFLPYEMKYKFYQSDDSLQLTLCELNLINKETNIIKDYGRVYFDLLDSLPWFIHLFKTETDQITEGRMNDDMLTITNPDYFIDSYSKIDYKNNGFYILNHCFKENFIDNELASKHIDIKFLKFDDKGNWIEKVEIHDNYDAKDKTKRDYARSYSNFVVRKINYY
ncbi:MAG: hypothetical protein IPI93_11305 [Sphingobacteriaceae bacterium]|nr:hypothetical protein [Sphingobacteriaceae bacterium]